MRCSQSPAGSRLQHHSSDPHYGASAEFLSLRQIPFDNCLDLLIIGVVSGDPDIIASAARLKIKQML
ncbi:protein of unknown function [Caballeronia sp. S22]